MLWVNLDVVAAPLTRPGGVPLSPCGEIYVTRATGSKSPKDIESPKDIGSTWMIVFCNVGGGFKGVVFARKVTSYDARSVLVEETGRAVQASVIVHSGYNSSPVRC